ncbi:hypothetical protein [Enterococcus innesii]|uniref:hypothetical protein n=1 Tax=Enterococcus innesii TaxID=2839759 RepID=UPI00232DA23C|nr:hypothetical protein [Enterococcus innesii]MDB7262263.1 hypothetical protein [Enterococcus faecium]MDC0753422.1 hypothetical protein [Enterococcus innesii]MDC0777523.1 hypothetical protein [Enterococcus innesii]MDC0780897.1 hypothetical protein [Enterococcus innesii]MDC0784285.1 hypothetical protein [Enterococcus innesii]
MKSLIIWLPTGQTMKFEDVQDFEGDPLGYEETIAFNYHGVSTDVRRKAVFMKSRLMGWALEQEAE